MSVTHSDTNLSNLSLNKFSSQSDYEAAVTDSQVGTNDVSFIEMVDSEIQAGTSKFGLVKTSDNYDASTYDAKIALDPATGRLYAAAGGVKTLSGTVRIWTLDQGAYFVNPGTILQYYGATSTNSFTLSNGGLMSLTQYSSTYKDFAILVAGATNNACYLYYGYCTSSNGSYTSKTISNWSGSNGSSTWLGMNSLNVSSINTTTYLQNGVCCGYITSSCTGKPVNLTLSGNTYCILKINQAYSTTSYTTQNAFYTRQEIIFPTLNKHYYRHIKYYSSTFSVDTSIANCDSQGWVEICDTYPSFANNSGKFLKVNSSANGVEWSTVESASAVSQLTDVQLSSLANNNILQYNSTQGKWINTTAPSGTIPSPTASGQYLYSPDGTNVGWSTLGATLNANYNYSTVSCDEYGSISIEILDDSQNYFVCNIPSNYDGENYPNIWVGKNIPSTNTCIHYILIINNSDYDLEVDLTENSINNYGPSSLPVIPAYKAVEISFMQLSDIYANIWTNTMTLDYIAPV